MKKISCIIPFRNEEDNIKELVSGIRKSGLYQQIILKLFLLMITVQIIRIKNYKN